jgi:calcium-dependent protein kinase
MGVCGSNLKQIKQVSQSDKTLPIVFSKKSSDNGLKTETDVVTLDGKFKRRENKASTTQSKKTDISHFTRRSSRARSLIESAKNGSKFLEKELEIVVNSNNIIEQNAGLPMDDYKLVKKLGDGSFGSVYLVHHRLNKMERAMKKIKKSNSTSSQDEDEVLNEINILKKLDHPNIVKIFEFYNTKDAYYLITEFCQEGELYDKIKHKFTEQQIAIIFHQVFSGLNYLHINNIIHRDLKLENILVDQVDQNHNLMIKIIDFGTAKILQKNKSEKAVIGSSYYMAPEVLKKNYNEKCDTWSCGVILYMLLFGIPPFDAKEDEEILEKIKIGKYDNYSERFRSASKEARDLVMKLLEYNTAKRYSAKEALQHPFFKKYNAREYLYDVEEEKSHQFIKNIQNYKFETKLQQLVLAFIVHNIKENSEIKQAHRLFRRFDDNNDGKITKQELTSGLLRFLPEEEVFKTVDDIFLSLDGDNNGHIECQEFVRACIDKAFLLSDQILKFSFNYFDKDGSGKISMDELKVTFKTKNDQITIKVLENMVNDIDANGDGQIDFNEFKQMMKNMVTANE